MAQPNRTLDRTPGGSRCSPPSTSTALNSVVVEELRTNFDRLDQDRDVELVSHARKSADAKEGVRAMLEKRRPVFRGE